MKALQSFEADYRETYGLIRYALGQFPGLNPHADDLLQDVFLSYWQHRDAIAPEKRRAWLLVTARHKAIDTLRRMQAHRTDLHDFVEMEPKEALWASDPLHEARVMKIGQMLDKLPEGTTSRTFQRFYRNGDSLNTIAKDCQKSIGTITSRVSRMREKLRLHFREAIEAMDA
jgi:RNA polymerase sigma factor (sigma-70 family)